jgi:hypothetical protein
MLFTKLKTTALTGVTVASVAMMPLAPAQTQSTDPIPAQEKGQRKENIEQPGAAVRQMIDQLASPKFAVREAAAKELRRIGEPALAQLRQAARDGKELELRRRAAQVVRAILDDIIEQLLKEETREDEIYCRKVTKILERVTDVGKERLDADRGTTPQENVPFLSDAYLRLARARKKLGENVAAADAFQQAESYCKDHEKIREMRFEMLPVLMPLWEKTVRDNIARDPSAKALAEKYLVVLLHSRRYARHGYGQSSYSFIYETADPGQCYNDVQLQFDNGVGDRTFQVNMVVHQKNTVADLGIVDFNIDPSLTKADFAGPDREQHEAVRPRLFGKSGRQQWQSVFCPLQGHGS